MMKTKIVTVILAVMLFMGAAPAAFADDQQPTANTEPAQEETVQEQPAADVTGTEDTNDNNTATEAGKDTVETKTSQDSASETAAKTVEQNVKLQVTVKATARGNGTIKVKWTKIKGSKGYKIYRSARKDGKYKKVYTTKKAGRTSWNDKSRKLKRNRTYYYKAIPRNRAALTVKKTVTASNGTAAKSDSTKARVKNTIKARKSMTVKATAYSGGGRCANGKKCAVGRIAVDPTVIKLGTWVYIDGYGLAQACDTGGAIKGKKIDLYFNGGEAKCSGYGVKKVKLFVL
ncbi:MAG: 3D domain-containing protein [Eubacteriaceae bacterium]|nr:3D domain-containing protein [Eubacteriaceae bacterium]